MNAQKLQKVLDESKQICILSVKTGLIEMNCNVSILSSITRK